MKKLLMTTLVCLMVLGVTSTAKAVVLAPGAGTTAISGAAFPSWITHLASTTVPFSFGSPTALKVGTVSQNVYSNSTGLLFSYLITRNASAPSEFLSRMTATFFSGFAVDADYDSASSGNVADSVDRLSGSTVGFDFDPLDAGETSRLVWIQTDAQYYGSGVVSLINGGSQNLTLYGPTVPEPATLSLLGLGVLGLFGLRRKSRLS